MAFGGLRGTLTGFGTSIVTPETADGSVAVSLQDLIVVFVAEAAANTVTTVTDNLGQTYTAINAGTLSSVGFRGYYRYVTVAGTLTQVSCTMTSSSNDHAISVAVFEGPFTSTPLDRAPANTTDAATPYTCAATTVLSQANELIVAGLGLIRCQTATATAPNTLALNTLSAAANTNNAVSSTIGRQVVAATTSVTPVFASSGTITGGVQIVATFRQGSIDTTPGTAGGTSNVTGGGRADFTGVGGNATGTSTVDGRGRSDASRPGTAAGTSTVTAEGLATSGTDSPGAGAASAVGSATGVGVSTSPTRSGLVASSSVSTGDANTRTTPAMDTTGANLLLVHVTHTTSVSFSISDNYGNTWSFDTSQGNKTTSPDMVSRIYRVTSQTPNVGPGHTITVSTGGGYPTIEFSAWRSGVPWSLGAITVGKDGLPHGASALTTVRTGDLVFSFAGGNNTLTSVSQGAILDRVDNVASQNWATAYAYLIANTAPNFTNSWTGTGEAVVINYFLRGIWHPDYGIGASVGSGTAVAAAPTISDPTMVGAASGTSTASAGSDPNTVYWKDSGTVWLKSNAGLDAVNPSNTIYAAIRASLPHTTGLWYCEIEFISGIGSNCGFGVADDTTAAGSGLDVYNPAKIGAARQDTFTYLNGFTAPNTTGIGTVNVGTRIGLAIDCDHQELYIANGGTFIGSSDPVTRTNPRIAWYGQAGINIFPAVSTLSGGVRIHAHAATQTYTAPTGYTAWGDTLAGDAFGAGSASGVGTATGGSPLPPIISGLVAYAETAGSPTSGNSGAGVDTTGANLLVAHFTTYFQSDLTVTDNKGNTWTKLGTAPQSGGATSIFYYVNDQAPNVGTGHIVSWSGVTAYSPVQFAAFGSTTPWSVDEVVSDTGDFPHGSGGIVTEADGELSVTGATSFGTFTSISDSFTILGNIAFASGNNMSAAFAWKIADSTGTTVNPIWSGDSNGPVELAAFKGNWLLPGDTGTGSATGSATVLGRSFIDIGLIAHAEGDGGADGGVTNSVDTTGANLLIVHVSAFDNPATISDSKGNTWTLLGNTNNDIIGDFVYYVDSQTPNVGPGHTVTHSGSGVYSYAELLAFAISAPWTFDEINGAIGNPPIGASLTTEQDVELVISTAAGDVGGISYISITDDFNIIHSAAGVAYNNYATASAYKIQRSIATVQAIWSASGYNNTATQIFAFKPGVAAADTGSAFGIGLAAAYGCSDVRSVGNAAGTSEAVSIAEVGTTTGDMHGTGTATGVGKSDKTGVGAAPGLGTATATGRVDFYAVGSASGLGAANGISTADARSVGNATGTGTAVGIAAEATDDRFGDGTAPGQGAANGHGRAHTRAHGDASGLGTVTGNGRSDVHAVGNATGLGTAAASGSADARGVGAATGTGTAEAIALLPGASVGQLLQVTYHLDAGRATGQKRRGSVGLYYPPTQAQDAQAYGALLVVNYYLLPGRATAQTHIDAKPAGASLDQDVFIVAGRASGQHVSLMPGRISVAVMVPGATLQVGHTILRDDSIRIDNEFLLADEFEFV